MVSLPCAARGGSLQAVWSTMSALVLHFARNGLTPLSTCRNSECSPRNTSTQCLADEKPFTRPPTVAPLMRALHVWASLARLLVICNVCWDITALSLGGKLERHSKCGLYMCHRQTEDFTEATYHFIMCSAPLVLSVLFPFASKSKLLIETYLDWVVSESLYITASGSRSLKGWYFGKHAYLRYYIQILKILKSLTYLYIIM